MAIGRHGTVATDEARKETLRRLGEVARGAKIHPKREINAYVPLALRLFVKGIWKNMPKCIASPIRRGIILCSLNTIFDPLWACSKLPIFADQI